MADRWGDALDSYRLEIEGVGASVLGGQFDAALQTIERIVAGLAAADITTSGGLTARWEAFPDALTEAQDDLLLLFQLRGQAIRALRRRAGWTLARLAEAAGMKNSQSVISELEVGKATRPRLNPQLIETYSKLDDGHARVASLEDLCRVFHRAVRSAESRDHGRAGAVTSLTRAEAQPDDRITDVGTTTPMIRPLSARIRSRGQQLGSQRSRQESARLTAHGTAGWIALASEARRTVETVRASKQDGSSVLNVVGDRLSAIGSFCDAYRVTAGLLTFDLDGFADINNHFGTSLGDHVLLTVESIVETAVEHQFVSRLDHDEFACCSVAITAGELASLATDVLLRIASYPWRALAPDLFVLASAGGVLRHTGEAGEQLLLRALVGTRQAKEHGGNRFALGPVALPLEMQEDVHMWIRRASSE